MSVKILTFFNLKFLCFFIKNKTNEDKNYRSVERPASCRQEPCVSARQFQQQDSNVREYCQPPKGTFSRKINKFNGGGINFIVNFFYNFLENLSKPYQFRVKQRSCADVNSPYKRKCWTKSGGPLVTLLHYSEGRHRQSFFLPVRSTTEAELKLDSYDNQNQS